VTELVDLRKRLAEDPDDARTIMLLADACQLERVRIVAACTERVERLVDEGAEDVELQSARHNEICEAEIMLLKELAKEFEDARARLSALDGEKLNAAATLLHADLPKGVFNRIMDHVGATYRQVHP
jgi:hypothetical protein